MWKKLSSIKFDRRRLSILLVCLIFVLLPVSLLLHMASRQMGEGNIYEVSLASRSKRQPMAGNGLNLRQLAPENLIANPGFEPLIYQQDFFASGGDDQRILLKAAEQKAGARNLPADDFFKGAELWVYSGRGSERSLKYEGSLASIEVEETNYLQSIPLRTSQDENFSCHSYFEGEQVYLGGEAGEILLNPLANVQYYQLPTTLPLISLAEYEGRVLALDSAGRLYAGQDKNFVKIYGPQDATPYLSEFAQKGPSSGQGQNNEASPQDLQEIILAKGTAQPEIWGLDRRGKIYRASLEQPWQNLDLETLESTFTASQIASHEGRVYALSREGGFYRWHSEDNWEALLQPALFKPWQNVSFNENLALLSTAQGEAMVLDLESSKYRLFSGEDFQPAPASSLAFQAGVIISPLHFLLMTEEQVVWESRDGGESWQNFMLRDAEGARFPADSLYLNREGSLLALSREAGLGRCELGAVLHLDTALEEGVFQAGDQVHLRQYSFLPRSGLKLQGQEPGEISPAELYDWYVAGNTAAFLQSEELPTEGGRGALQVTAAASPHTPETYLRGLYTGALLEDSLPHADALHLAYKFSPTALKLMQGASVFELEFWAKADHDDAYIDVELSGPTLPRESVRRYPGTAWSKQSLVFIVPWHISPDSDLRLCFNFVGGKEFYVDACKFQKSDTLSARQEEVSWLQEMRPQNLRLAYLELGNPALPAEFYFTGQETSYLSHQQGLESVYAGSLRQALELCESTQSNPWFCLQPGISESELRHLMQYLFASRQTDYGYKRIQDGSPERWHMIFDNIYLEFSETPGSLMEVDRERSDFVDWAIDVIRSTPEYEQVKQQVIFIDGMSYSEGNFLSSADIYACPYGAIQPCKSRLELEELKQEKREKLLRDPQRVMALRPQLFKSSLASSEARLSDYLSQILDYSGQESLLTLADLAEGSDTAWPRTLLAALLESTRHLPGLYPQKVIVKNYLAQEESESLLAYGYTRGEHKLLIVLNLGDEVNLLRLADAQPNNSVIYEYDQKGTLLDKRVVGRREGSVAILPGGAVVMERGFRP